MPTTTTTTAVPAEIHFRRETEVTNDSALREKGQKPRMVRLTVNLPSHLVEQMRDAVYWTPGLTLAWMIARAVRTSLTELETVHQGPFPRRLKPLRAGRPRLLGQAMNVLPKGGENTDNQGNGTLRVSAPATRMRRSPLAIPSASPGPRSSIRHCQLASSSSCSRAWRTSTTRRFQPRSRGRRKRHRLPASIRTA